MRDLRVGGFMQSDVKRLAFSESELGQQLRISPAALRKWRAEGRGPRFVRLGKCVRYLVGDVESWLKDRVVNADDPTHGGQR